MLSPKRTKYRKYHRGRMRGKKTRGNEICFGSFSLHHRKARTGRNPKTGQSVQLQEKSVPHFKPGKELRDLVNQSKTNGVPLPKE